MRARTNISLKQRRTVTLSDFKGVDLNTSPLRVANSRASSMKNFICDNGVLHKRPGWEEQFRMKDADGKPLAVHGIFPFDERDGAVLLVHAGTAFYRAVHEHEHSGGWNWTCTQIGEEGITVTEDRAQCFYRGGKAFFIGCGNYLVYGEFDGAYALKEVTEIATVPTTSIGITAQGGGTSLDAVNLLTRTRVNTIVGTGGILGSYDRFALDGTVDVNRPIHIEGNGLLGSLESGNWQYYRFTLDNLDGDGNVVSAITGSLTLGAVQGTPDLDAISQLPDHNGGSGYPKKVTAQIEEDQRCTIRFDFPTGPTEAGVPNITVTYDAVQAGRDASRVQDCRFGATFGVNGANDRLFLAGNLRYPNMDIWSEYDDFTYFPDGNTMEVGASHAAITAYARISDTTLAVMKEDKAGEPTVFYRTGKERSEEDGALTQWFPVSAGIAGDGVLNPHAVATLAGDVMCLTRRGVVGIVLSGNVASGERYMRERSRPIYSALAHSGVALESAAAVVYRNRFYLSLPDAGKCFVADAHYTAVFEGSTDYNYEWWVWENVAANCFAEYGGTLYFGTPDGLVCAFTEGVFSDRTHTALGEGDLLDEAGGRVVYSEGLSPVSGDRVTLHGNVYDALATNVQMGESPIWLTVGEAALERLYPGRAVVLDNGNSYTVGDVDGEAFAVTLKNEYGNCPSFSEWGFSLYERADGVECFIDEVDGNNHTFSVKNAAGETMFLSTLRGEFAEWTGRFTHAEPVAAEWKTPILDFGTSAYSKTLLSLTVTLEPSAAGAVTVGYETREGSYCMEAPGEGGLFSFDNINFHDFTFDALLFARSYTKNVNARNFNFLRLRFGSATEQDCAVSGMTLLYKINQKNKGVR